MSQRCRCDREEPTRLEFRDRPQVVRDLDICGQPSFWVYRPACHRCSHCHRRQRFIPPFKRKDVSYTCRFEQHLLQLLIGSKEEEVARLPGQLQSLGQQVDGLLKLPLADNRNRLVGQGADVGTQLTGLGGRWIVAEVCDTTDQE